MVRHFDAPDSVPTRFYEVRAKSILNRVPEASRMPFRWTINPYRGCTHACALLRVGRNADPDRRRPAQSRWKSLRWESPSTGPNGRASTGGTSPRRSWTSGSRSSRPTAVVSEDGTELILSGDHRLLTDRGWKHVINSERSEPDRPHLTTLESPGRDRRLRSPAGSYGRLPAGLSVRDGPRRRHAWVRTRYPRRAAAQSSVHSFRLALADPEALMTASRSFLDQAASRPIERSFSAATSVHREVRASLLRPRREPANRIAELIDWPLMPSLDWCRWVSGRHLRC